MSFVITTPAAVITAAGNLAGVGSTLGEAVAAAAGPTTNIAAAAGDEISTALSQLFGSYGQQFQVLNAQAAAFHNQFVNLLTGGATAYLDTEITNARQGLTSRVSSLTPVGASAAAATTPLLGGLGPILGGGSLGPIFVGGSGGIFGGLSSTLGELSSVLGGGPLGPILSGAGQEIGAVVSAVIGGDEASLLSGLFVTGATASQAGSPWQALFVTTGANLHTTFNNWAAHPFPVLQQVLANQKGYLNTIGTDLALALQNLPTTLADAPANLQLAVQHAVNFNYGAAAQEYINRQIGYNQATNAALQRAGIALQARLPVFEHDLAMAHQAAMAGDYHGAVQGIPQAFVDLFVSGVNISNLSTVTVQGPAGELAPIADISAQQQQDLINLLPGAIPKQIAQNFFTAISTATSSLSLAVIGPPIATLDGFATGATALGAALQTGNGVAVAGALVNMPAYVLNGFLNGNTVVDLTIPVTATVDIPGFPSIGAGTPIVVHLPFQGILTQPQPITATIEVSAGVTTIPINLTFDGMQTAGAVPTLLSYMPQQVAAAISPQ